EGVGAQGVLCRTQSTVLDAQDFSGRVAAQDALLRLCALFLACDSSRSGTRRRSGLPPGRKPREGSAGSCFQSSRRSHSKFLNALEAAARDQAAPHAASVRAFGWTVFDQPAPGGGPVKRASDGNQYLIVVPAFNEEAAIADVVR